MAYRILVLGASYGSLFATKCLMAGHDVTLVCRTATAALINSAGTTVCMVLKGESASRCINSIDLPGRLMACTPGEVEPAGYDLVVLAMQEPHYAAAPIAQLLRRIGTARVPCLSLMNMPPLPYLKRLVALDTQRLGSAYTDPRVWEPLDPQYVTLCSPDPQTSRPADKPANVLHVSLATNFKAAELQYQPANLKLRTLAADIDNVRLHELDVPVKLRVHASPTVPLAKWPMLMTGNYRCITSGTPISIRDVVHANLDLSRKIYALIGAIAVRIGAQPDELVPFEKYAAAAEQLVKPSSVARALAAGATAVERVDKLMQLIGHQMALGHPNIDRTVALIDANLARNASSKMPSRDDGPTRYAQVQVLES
jgi:hypothetical protein